jgi:hypothetical protein
MMKTITIAILAAMLFALPAFAQTPPNASSLAAPLALPSAVPTPPVAAILNASVNGGPYGVGPFVVHVGDVVTFSLSNPGPALPSTLAVLVNGKVLSFPSGKPLGFKADKTGVWNISLDIPGFISNTVTITCE